MPKTEVMEEQVTMRMKSKLLRRVKHAADLQGLQMAEFLRLAALRAVEQVERRGN